jgi:hypothetical protein
VRLPSSYRDPSGFIFSKEGVIYRQINLSYQDEYDFLIGSGLYHDLVESGSLVSHAELEDFPDIAPGGYKIIKPDPIPFISYPYEWCFSQLKDAALKTIQIQKRALEFGMTLKDSSSYNIQFLRGKPVLIDTLSFQTYREGSPWIAYRQFCQHFLAPLALSSYRRIWMGQLLQVHLDGIPLKLASSLLPTHTRFKPSMQVHIHLHSLFQGNVPKQTADKESKKSRFSLRAFLGLLDSLESAVRGLKWRPLQTEWADYYDGDSYTRPAFNHKSELVTGFLSEVDPSSVWDLGSNTGQFARLAGDMGIPAIAFDQDPAAVENSYLASVKHDEKHVLPLVLDLSSPSPRIGWANNERMDLSERGPADMLMALALIHHLAIARNVPLGMIAEFFRRLCTWIVIEFVPKSDKKVVLLLSNRTDIFPDYTQDNFESEFSRYFDIKSARRVTDSERTLYLMKAK